ncbi:MAG: Rne/Rng family ribonuclease [Calditrichia bacterium]|nr:Rne/Rng family ribonuclease [Calditrichia bacterium]
MNKEIIINSSNEETRIAITEDNKFVDLYVERPESQRMVGDIYKGKVSRVLPGMQAAFISIGFSQNAFLHFSDVSDFTHMFIDDIEKDQNNEVKIDSKINRYNVEKDLKQGQDIIVQVMKEPIGTKGPRVTTQISIPGRFVVLVPNEKYIGVSRKISQIKEKKRLKSIAYKSLPKNYGLIIRTVAENKTEKVIVNDINALIKIWKNIENKIPEAKTVSLIYKDMGMASSVIRDLFTSDVDKLIVDSRKMMRIITTYVKDVAPQLKKKIEYYNDKTPVFDKYNIEKELDKLISSKVWIKNGAYLIIQQTEAMVVIDVNSGKFIGKSDHETNSLKINLEAAKEIARQVRLRDLGGLVVIDFIDVLQPKNKDKIFVELKKEFHKDRAITKIEKMSRFGLIEMTRQRVRESVIHDLHDDCPTCNGSGLCPTIPTLVSQIERWIQRYRATKGDRRILIRISDDVYKYLTRGRFSKRLQLMWKYWMKIDFKIDESIPFREFKVYDRKNQSEIKVK